MPVKKQTTKKVHSKNKKTSTKSSLTKKIIITSKKTQQKNKTKQIVQIYSTPTCPYCKLAKEFLKENNVAYKERNVAQDQKAADEMVKKSGQMGVPVIEIGKKIIVGFDKEAIKKILKV